MTAPSILVIEPSLTLRAVISTALHRVGYPAVHTYAEALLALSCLRSGALASPAFVLLTKDLPLLDGYAALRLLHERAPAAVIVMVMNDEGYLERSKARLAGAAAVLIKPYTVENLIHLIHRYVPLNPRMP